MVRVYAEAETQVCWSGGIQLAFFICSFPTQPLADELALQVAGKVFDLAGGTGEPPTLQ